MKKSINNKPLIIGLTGGIGSGKTTVSNIFKILGVPVFNSDEESKNLLKNNSYIINNVINIFGNSIVRANKIDTKILGHIAFNNKKKLQKLNNIIHPVVLNNFRKWVSKQKNTYLIKESAILFESKTYKDLDKIILIKAPLKLRINRIIDRDKRTKKEIKSIINNQLNLNKQLDKVNYIINNNEKSLLTPKVIDLNLILSRL